MLSCGTGHLADGLIQIAGVDGGDPLAGLNPLAIDNQRVTLPELGRDRVERPLHGNPVLFDAEIHGYFVAKFITHCGCAPSPHHRLGLNECAVLSLRYWANGCANCGSNDVRHDCQLDPENAPLSR